MDKFELEKVLSSILGDYGFMDRIKVLEYHVNETKKNIWGIFAENNSNYNFSIDIDNKKNLEHLAWVKNN